MRTLKVRNEASTRHDTLGLSLIGLLAGELFFEFLKLGFSVSFA
jgi:hypothetical protein